MNGDIRGKHTNAGSNKIVDGAVCGRRSLPLTSSPLTSVYGKTVNRTATGGVEKSARSLVYGTTPKCDNEVGRMQAIGHSQHRHTLSSYRTPHERRSIGFGSFAQM